MDFKNRVVGSNLTLDEMADDILWYVETRDWVTYAELTRRYGEQAKGDYQHHMPSMNIIFWPGMSEKFVEALEALSQSKPKRIHPHPSSLLVYLIDGGMLELPLARRPPKNGYKKPHWAPMSFRPGPRCDHSDCPWEEEG